MHPADYNRLRSAGNEASIEPIAAPISDACRMSGLSRSEMYRRLTAGDIQAVKSGSRTLVLIHSLRAHLASLPPATFGHRQQNAAA
jgi:hypothetical protein